jgi:hypothetical protein
MRFHGLEAQAKEIQKAQAKGIQTSDPRFMSGRQQKSFPGAVAIFASDGSL